MNPRVSFIIPALNEEKRIGTLLGSLRKLDGKYNHEVIVADGYSTDRTADIARKLGARVIPDNAGTPRTIANGRNSGAKVASGDLLIFCDADTDIRNPEAFLQRVFTVFEDPEICGAVPNLSVFPCENKPKDRFFHKIFNNLIRLSFRTRSPFCGGQCQIVRREVFIEEKGYNPEIVHGEDTDLFRRLNKRGKLYYFSDLEVYESPRRYRKYGYIMLFFKGIFSITYQRIFGKNFFKEWKRVEDFFSNKPFVRIPHL